MDLSSTVTPLIIINLNLTFHTFTNQTSTHHSLCLSFLTLLPIRRNEISLFSKCDKLCLRTSFQSQLTTTPSLFCSFELLPKPYHVVNITMERSILSPKQTNWASPSPTKLLPTKLLPTKLLPTKLPTKLLPIKMLLVLPTKSPSKRPRANNLLPLRPRKLARTTTEPGFKIFEDPVSPREPTIDADQENVLVLIRRQLRRGVPLQVLLMQEFPGFLHAPAVDGKIRLVQLTQTYVPKHYDNDFGSLHRQAHAPSYTTPARDKRHQYQVRSRQDEPGLPTPRPRSSSVGANNRKRPIVTKNPFVVA